MIQQLDAPAASNITSTARRKISYEEFLDCMEEGVLSEWVDGEIIEMRSISLEHQDVNGFLLSIMRIYVEIHGLGRILFEPFQMKTGPDLPGRSPDVMFVATEYTHRLTASYLDGPTDLAVEIVSPESRGGDRGDKYYEYEKGGVREYWLLDPPRKQAEFYSLGDDGIYHLLPVDSDGIFRSRVLDGFWLRVDWLWQDPLPSVIEVAREWGLM